MCGICGFISRQNISLQQLKRMNDTMCHRGPDDSGEEIYSFKGDYAIGLAQRRLSVQDVSELGHQPMHSDDRRISVVYNGEIYNFPDLRKELSDYPFRSNCDTEVIIAAYLKWGIGCVHKFNGMFAIALFDRETQDFYLVRDRIGKKPLYYQTENGNLYFASELKPLMEREGFQKKINKEILSRYLFQQYIGEPDSIFESVYKLEPGGVLHFHLDDDRKAEVKKWKYWDIKKVYHQMRTEPVEDYVQAKEELKKRLAKAVSDRMLADVPVGTFLSGGYDSSLITAMAAECAAEPVKTFSIGFHEKQYNEAHYAKQVAEYLGTRHTEVYITEKEMLDLVEDIPQFYDEPFADSSQIPSMLVSGLARKDVTVALSGDGGDEFFCGYNIYEKVKQAQLLDMPGGMIHMLFNLPGIRNIKLNEKLPFKVRVVTGNRNRDTKVQLGEGSYVSSADRMVLGDGLPCNYHHESEYQVRSWQVRRMLLDMETYLPGDILCKVDRASMKYSLETRCPILDKEVMEYSFRLDHDLKYRQGNKKRILKDIAYDYIPRELLDRPKVGFGVPLDKWLRGALSEQLLDMCNRDYLRKQGIFDADYVADMIAYYMKTGDGGPATGANYSRLTWSFFTFQKWYRKYC